MKSEFKNHFQAKSVLFGLAILLLFAPGWAQEEKLYEEGYLMPSELVQDFMNRDGHTDTLNNISPDGLHFMIPVSDYFSSLKLMTQRTLRLGMLEICPDVSRSWRLSTYGKKGIKIYSLEQKKSWMIQVPENSFVSDMVWSPDGKDIAFLAHLPQGTQVWTANVKSGKAQALDKSFVMATLTGGGGSGRGTLPPSQMLQWTPSGSIITLLVPPDRGPEPKDNPIPSAPLIRHTRKKPAPTSTYSFLLRTNHDKDLLEYHTTSQLAELSAGKKPRLIGEPAMYTSLSLSPDGQYILTEKMTRPFSYIVSYSSFPREQQVLDREGQVLATLLKNPLREGSSGGRGGGGADQPRDIFWRPDGKGLSLLMQEPREKGDKDEEAEEEEQETAPRMDRLLLLTPPFDLEKAQVLVLSKQRFGSMSYSKNGRYAFTQLSGEDENCETGTHIVAFDLEQSPPEKHFLLKKIETQNPLKLPGSIMVRMDGNGIPYALTSEGDRHVYLSGPGYQEDFKPKPFIDRFEIINAQKERVFEGSSDMFEQPVVTLDRNLNSLIINRESKTVFPDSWLWTRDGSLTNLTNNRNPYPEFTDCRRENFEFTRRDGLKVRGTISLPSDYKPGTRLPGVFWTYPSEYSSNKEYETATLRSLNLNSFTRFSYRNASDVWLSQGYALVEPDIPIIGSGDTYNDNFIAHLVDSMYAAIRKVDELGYVDIDKLGHGGHSYGAFTTANILSRSPFFKAGIAGDGAYNRTLTPMTFQRERRNIWEAQDVYIEMSPFFQADHMDTPLLMYHGAADNNTGTFLIQSERYMQLLTGLGKNAVLYIYPFESHGPRCKETYMDMWNRWLGFFGKYVKGEQTEAEK
ncbi:MAG: prolyl oligopeptidase family serine peptidase [Candidatus Aminicenantes bacterium]|nr:prolyl oligopeptidase family serine peptidase [Candidatus Aminicenantes bacterium]